MGISLKLTFVDADSPQLDRVEFSHPSHDALYLSVRGKTAGGYTQTNRTFQWTSACQGLSLLFLKGAVYAHPDRPAEYSDLSPSLEGGKGSIVASIDYSLDKQPLWLMDMFGVSSSGKAFIRHLLRRSNPGLKRAGLACVSLNSEILEPGTIRAFWDGRELKRFSELLELFKALEKACGAVRLEELVRAVPQSGTKVATPPRGVGLDSTSIRQAESRFKTPFVRQGTPEGDVFSRVYERNGALALVSIFAPLESMDVSKDVPVRIHSSCIPSEVLGTIDCDCHSQLHRAAEVLRQERGVLIHLFQEGRGAGLFSKYMGMSLTSQHGFDTYEAYNRLSIARDSRSYDFAAMVLEDLGIKRVALLSNNPEKVEGLREFGFAVRQRECRGVMTPQNVSYLYDKMTKGGHLLQEMFHPESFDFFLCESQGLNGHFKQVVIFGGDDTLWEDNVVYEDLIRQFVDHICQWIPTLPRHTARAILDQVELELIPKQGFGAPGFLKSLQEAFLRVKSEYGVNMEEPTELFNSVVPRLSGILTAVSHKTIEVLESLRDLGYGLILFCEGPLDIQLRKIAQSRLGTYFHAVCIVPRKNPEALKRLCATVTFSADEFVTIGSNLLTDIVPAREVGMGAIHFRNPNSWQLINRQSSPLPDVPEISSLVELLSPQRLNRMLKTAQ